MAQRGFNPGINIPNPGEVHPSVITSLQQIIFKLGRLSSPQFKGMSLADLAVSGAGFMKNDANGVITGGNTIAVDDLPAHAVTHENGGGDEVDHDSLSGFVANEHINHTSVTITGGGILSGGGDISANRSITLAHGDVDHDQTTNFVADEHVAHSGVSITGSGILSGGGDISASREISLAHSDVDHDQTTNFVANEHIDHTSVTLTAGTGLIGGGDISANRSFAVDGILEDLDTLGVSSTDGEIIVATDAGVLAWESGSTARTSLGLGTGDSPQFTGLTLTGNITLPDDGWIGLGVDKGKVIFDDTSGEIVITDLVSEASAHVRLAAVGGLYEGIDIIAPGDRAIRIYTSDDYLTASPAGAAIQVYGNGHYQLQGQAYIDSGAHDSAGIFLRTCGTSGKITERLRINAVGNIGIGGVTTPTALVHIDQTVVDGAKPVLLLDQADVSEEFIRFIGSAAAATLTQSIVAEADVTTATRVGFVKVHVQDNGDQITDQAYFMPIYTLA